MSLAVRKLFPETNGYVMIIAERITNLETFNNSAQNRIFSFLFLSDKNNIMTAL